MFGNLMGMMEMLGNYEDRKVARYEKSDLLVSTAQVTDSDYPFETAVGHPNYNKGKLVIVEHYESRVAAEQGHKRWIKTMTQKRLPKSLKDVSTSEIAKLVFPLIGEKERVRKQVTSPPARGKGMG